MAEQHPMRDAGLAVSLLSVVPTSSRWPDDGRTQVAGWFPAVGVLYGVLGYAIVKAADYLRVTPKAPYVVAALAVIAWALMSRLLHWDGLADVADGFWGSHDRERRLEIMADSHTGAFGAAAVTLLALLEVAAIGAIVAAPHELPLLLVPVISRFAATAAAWLGTPARPGGLGRSVMGAPSLLAILVAVLPLAGAILGMWIGFKIPGVLLGLFGVLVALAIPHLLSQRFGGVTGDVMGASVLITEAILFAAIALVV
ncbi:MAG: adenosylcobinamide-GDP ribazoletransferase [Coriobacteriia bacterium]|nr:adenosylcobinamide-GDP ribazoletransferase [Coriobacteriia bacterium]